MTPTSSTTASQRILFRKQPRDAQKEPSPAAGGKRRGQSDSDKAGSLRIMQVFNTNDTTT